MTDPNFTSTFRDSIGVNIHTNQAQYNRSYSQVKACMDYLGLTRVRDNWDKGGDTIGGLKFLTIAYTSANVENIITHASDEMEVSNEVDQAFGTDSTGVANAKSNASATVTQLANRKRLVGPSLANGGGSSTMGATFGIIPNTDAANVHCYRANQTQSSWISRLNNCITSAKAMCPYRPWMLTEMGAHDYTGANNHGHVYTPPDVYATQLISELLDAFARGAERCYIYELIDNSVAKPDDSEGHFGLFQYDYTPKPSAIALKNFITLYGDLSRDSARLLTDQLSTGGTDYTELQAQLTAANDTIANLTSQLTSANSQIAALQAQINSDPSNAALQAQVTALTVEIQDRQNKALQADGYLDRASALLRAYG